MTKAAPRSKSKVASKKVSVGSKKKVEIQVEPLVQFGMVSFSYQKVDYQIDLDKSKVYRRFIEVEKSKQGSIISAYRSTAGPRATA
jgi:hypothetical protein